MSFPVALAQPADHRDLRSPHPVAAMALHGVEITGLAKAKAGPSN